MTITEVCNAIIAKEEISAEMVEWAEKEKARIANANQRKAEKNAEKKATIDEPIKRVIVDTITTNATETDKIFTVSSLYDTADFGTDDDGNSVEVSKSKINAMCKALVAEGVLNVCDVKVKGGRTVKGYSLV